MIPGEPRGNVMLAGYKEYDGREDQTTKKVSKMVRIRRGP